MEEKLIEAVRLRQYLYDTSHADYMKTKLKTEKWEEVAKESDMLSGKFIHLYCKDIIRHLLKYRNSINYNQT